MSTPEALVTESRSSVEIADNSKGEPAVKVKVYADSVDLAAVDTAGQKALQVYNDVKANLR